MYIGEGENYEARINIDDFRIYDRVLSAAEVEKLYLEGSDRDLIAHYKFDADLTDSSGNNHTLTASNPIYKDKSYTGKSIYFESSQSGKF